MKFAIFYEITVPRKWGPGAEARVFHEVVEQVQLAEQVGFDTFWTVEHHFLDEFSHCSAPEVLYGYIAAKTSKIRIGHGVRLLPAPYNHPARVAEMGATLDIMCNGRLEFGTGRSATMLEMGGFGIDPADTRGMWEESLSMLPRMWQDDLFSHQGKYFSVPPRHVIPKPVQKPHPPLWMACTSPTSHELAGKKGLGLLSFTLALNLQEVGRRVQRIRLRPIRPRRSARSSTNRLRSSRWSTARPAMRPPVKRPKRGWCGTTRSRLRCSGRRWRNF